MGLEENTDMAMLLINLTRNPGPSSLQCRTPETYKQHSHFLVAFAIDAQQCCGRLCTSLRWSSRQLERRNVINLTSNPLKVNIKSSCGSYSEPVTTPQFYASKQYLSVCHSPVDLQKTTAGIQPVRQTYGSNTERNPVRETGE